MTALIILMTILSQDEKSRDAACLGMRFRDLTADERKAAGLEGGGAKILATVGGAAKAGLKKDDVIASVAGKPFKHADDLIKTLYMSKWDAIDVVRDGKRETVKLTLKELDAGPVVGEAPPDFTLASLTVKKDVELAKLVGARPVVLVFGSYT